MSTVTEETPEITEPTTHKWVYLFDEGAGDDKALLGGKGAGLCEMTRAGLPVPPGLVVTTEACNAFFDNDMMLRIAGDTLVLTPPLSISEDQIGEIMDKLNKIIRAVSPN